jgi:hypothetical protein
MKPSWIVSLDCISAQQHKLTHKYGECFYWVEQQNEFAWKIYTVCFHVGQMLFAGNKYLLLKRITVRVQTHKNPPLWPARPYEFLLFTRAFSESYHQK